MPYVIAQADCINCGKCRRECPTDTIHLFGQSEGKHWIEPARCIDCDLCARVCPMDCIARLPVPAADIELISDARGQARHFFASRRAFARSLERYARQVLAQVGPADDAPGG